MNHNNHHSDFRFAIIGCGKIAERHANILQHHGKIVAVCDVVSERANNLAALFGSHSYHDVDEMFNVENNIDIVAVCSPNGLHAEHSILAMKNGSQVVCEKPMALTHSDCLDMLSVAEKYKKKIFVVKQNRYNPPVVQLKKWMESSALGKILSVQVNGFWNRNPSYYHDSWKGSLVLDGGTLFTQFSHFIDLMFWLFGDMNVEHAMLENQHHKNIIDFEDSGNVNLKFTSGAIGSINYNVNAYLKNMEGSITVFGEKGTVKIGGQYLNELEYYCIEGVDKISLPSGNPANQYGNYSGSMSNHDLFYQHVIDVLRQNKSMNPGVVEAVKTVALIESIYKWRKTS